MLQFNNSNTLIQIISTKTVLLIKFMLHLIIKEEDVTVLSFKDKNGEGRRMQTKC